MINHRHLFVGVLEVFFLPLFFFRYVARYVSFLCTCTLLVSIFQKPEMKKIRKRKKRKGYFHAPPESDDMLDAVAMCCC